VHYVSGQIHADWPLAAQFEDGKEIEGTSHEYKLAKWRKRSQW